MSIRIVYFSPILFLEIATFDLKINIYIVEPIKVKNNHRKMEKLKERRFTKEFKIMLDEEQARSCWFLSSYSRFYFYRLQSIWSTIFGLLRFCLFL